MPSAIMSSAGRGKHPQLQRFYCYEAANDEGPQPHATGYLNPQQLGAWLPETRDVEAYFLGPTPFMKAVKSHLLELGVPPGANLLRVLWSRGGAGLMRFPTK
jgi:ferredoxin-NADP reductase